MGRPLGSKNKRPSSIAIGQSLAARGVDLAEKLLKLAQKAEETGDLTLAHKCFETLCRYSQVVPTAEVAGSVDDHVDPQLRELTTEELLSHVGAAPQ